MSTTERQTRISYRKKLVFSCLIFLMFIGLAELALTLTPSMMGFAQRGQYDSIMSGGTTIVCLGDSVTYGYDVGENDSWPMQLQSLLQSNSADISVVNRGGSGMDSSTILQREMKTVADIDNKGSRPVVLLMTGHNDLMGIGWRKWKAHDGKGANPDQVDRQPPRLYRILKWFWHTQSTPDDATWIKPEARETLIANIQAMNRKVEQANGTLYLLTYLLPGDATGKLWPNAAREIEKSREYQGIGNQLIRTIASSNNIPLIDIEQYAEAPEKWDDNWFMDHIHPTKVGHHSIAKTTLKWLSVHGELPVNMGY